MSRTPTAAIIYRCSYSAISTERAEAEAYLTKIDKAPGVVKACLDIVLSPTPELEIRQSAAIHMKNQVSSSFVLCTVVDVRMWNFYSLPSWGWTLC